MQTQNSISLLIVVCAILYRWEHLCRNEDSRLFELLGIDLWQMKECFLNRLGNMSNR